MTKRTRNHVGTEGARTRGLVLTVCALVALTALVLGGAFVYITLRDLWREQCRVTDPELDIVITTGKLIDPSVISYHFGLTNGANLATIPFADLRAKLLSRVPNIRDIRIERRLPNRVMIDVKEREPIARVIQKGRRGETSRVVDAEYVVFRYAGETDALPIIAESANERATLPGSKLTGLAAAATRLIATLKQEDLSELRVREIDATPRDYLLLKLDNTDTAKFAWEFMLDDTGAAREKLKTQLKHLQQAIAAHLTPPATSWNAKEWQTKRIFADPNNQRDAEKGKLP